MLLNSEQYLCFQLIADGHHLFFVLPVLSDLLPNFQHSLLINGGDNAKTFQHRQFELNANLFGCYFFKLMV